MDATAQQHLALDYLDLVVADYVRAAGGPVKTADVVREVTERLGASARLVRNELPTSARLTMVDRRWDLRSRHETTRRSLDGAMKAVLREYGRPMSLAALSAEVNLRRADQVAPPGSVELLARSRDSYLVTDDAMVALREWIPQVAPGDDDTTVRQVNFFGQGELLDTALDQLDVASAQSDDSDLNALHTLVNSAQEPIALRLALYALWRSRKAQPDLTQVLKQALGDDRFAVLPGPALATKEYAAQLAGVLRELAGAQGEEALDTEAPELDEILAAEIKPAAFSLAPDDLDEVARIITEAGEALGLASLVSDVFELFPGDVQYVDAVRAMQAAVAEDSRFVELGENYWHLRLLLPPALHKLPATLQLSPIEATSVTGEHVDQPLTDEGLEGGLEFEVHAYDLEDVGEEAEVADLPQNLKLAGRQRFVTSYRHVVSGTLKVRKIDRGVFPGEPDIMPIDLLDEASGQVFKVWLNNEYGLLCGLEAWYQERLQPTGHVLHIERREEEGIWAASIEAEPDPTQLIPQSRLDELLLLRVKLEHDPQVSVLDIMKQLMAHHTAGVSFRRLATECNIVRRVAKRVIASNLSSYPMFSLNEDQTLWLYDERRASKPRRPDKKPFAIA